MNQISESPNTYDFGHDFNYDQWPIDTEILLCNVPWNNDYRDVVNFDTHAELNAYLDRGDKASVRLTKLSYVANGTPIKINIPFNRANRFNYVRVKNPVQPVPGSDVARDYYYFILSTQRSAGNTTVMNVQLDAWATYWPEVEMGRCYIERGHIGIANSRQLEANGRVYLTQPEGLDTGGDMQVLVEQRVFQTNQRAYLITSTTNLTANPGTVEKPNMQSARGSYLQGIYMGTNTYLVSSADFLPYMLEMAKYPWVTQGLIRIAVIPDPSALGLETRRVPRNNNYPPGPSGSNDSYLQTLSGSTFSQEKEFNYYNLTKRLTDSIPERYRHLKKFGTFPYSFMELTAFGGSSVLYKFENIQQKESRFPFLVSFSLVPGNERVEATLPTYNGEGNVGEKHDVACVMSNIPTVPAVNNMAISALASQAHSLAAAYSGADWAQQRALAGNAAAYDNATVSANAAADNARIGRNLDIASTNIGNEYAGYSAGVNAVGGIVGSAGAGAALGPGGAAAGAAHGAGQAVMAGANHAISVGASNAQLGARNAANAAIAGNNLSAANAIRDTNRGLADWAAKGDYANTIAALNAKVQDTKLTQPSMSGAFGGEVLRVLQEGFAIVARARRIDQAAIKRIGEYWLRYGYAVNQFAQIDRLDVMENFTYWKLSETYFKSATVPEYFKQTLRGIFEKGVTVWNDPDKIGMIDIADNKPLTGVELP